MSGGPRPLPKNVRMLRGGKKNATTAKDEIDLPVSIPEPPSDLTEAELECYNYTAKRLANMRVLNDACRDALVLYSRAWCLAQHARGKMGLDIIVMSPKGYPIQNPWLAVARKEEDRCLKIMQEFGLTPSAQTRISQGK